MSTTSKIEPWARGGESRAHSMRILCYAHNRYTAELEYGADHIRKKFEQRRAQRTSSGTCTDDDVRQDSGPRRDASVIEDARSALRNLGFSRAEVDRRLAQALARVGEDADVTAITRAALQHPDKAPKLREPLRPYRAAP